MLGQLDLASQSTFAGRYRVVRRLAAGGMGAVFEVVHIETQRRRALKVMLPELLSNRQLRERFQMEARITANVESEYIVDVFDAGIDDATSMPFLVMELLNGEDLGKVLERSGPLSPERVIAYLQQVGSALDKTHAAGIVHRDLKPENLFLTHREDGSPRVKILDFGISKVISDASSAANATRGIGTPLYMAPEQVHARPLSASADLYALGLIAYTLLVGSSYWQSDADRFDNPITFVVHTSKGVSDSASSRAALVGRTLPAAFDAWFHKATHLTARNRFRSAAELVSTLAAVLGVERGGSLGPDSTGAFAPVPNRSAAAETMVAKTAPGTELHSRGTSPRSKTVLWLGGGAALLAVAALAALLASPRHGSSAAATQDVTASAHSALGLAGVTAETPLADRGNEASAKAAAAAVEPALSAASATPVASAKPKKPGSRKAAPTKASLGAAPPRPKYTRD